MSLLIEILDSNIWILITAVIAIIYTEYSIKRASRAIRRFVEEAIRYYVNEIMQKQTKKKDDNTFT